MGVRWAGRGSVGSGPERSGSAESGRAMSCRAVSGWADPSKEKMSRRVGMIGFILMVGGIIKVNPSEGSTVRVRAKTLLRN